MDLFRELLALELELAHASKSVPTVDEYRARFPDRIELVDAVFAEAVSTAGISQPRPARSRTEVGPVRASRAVERFRILRFHREGGLGRVYLARDEELGRDVAVKEIRPDKASQADLRNRFVLEAEINGGLEHPGIVPVYSLGAHDDGRPFYAMRFVEGDSFKEAIDSYHKECPRPDPTAVEFRKLLGRFIDVCEAIAFAHSKGVLHRDLKPHNVMLGRFGETLLIDWGLAKATGCRESENLDAAGAATLVPPSSSGHAPTLGALGSPLYMSPEQAAGEPGSLTPSTDVYGLGAILFALLTGEPPVDGKSTDEIVDQVRLGAIRLPRSLNPHIPRALEAVCVKALAPQPCDRYPSALALAEEVEHWLADEPVAAWREPLSGRARRWAKRHRTAMTGGAAAVLAGFIGLLGVLALQVSYNSQLKQANAATSKAKNEAEAALAQSEQARNRAEAVLKFLKEDVLAAARPEGENGGLGVDVTVRKAVDAAEPRIAGAFKEQPIVEAEVRDTLGSTYFYAGDAPLAIRQHERAFLLRQTRLGPDHPDTLTSRNNLGAAYLDAGRTDDAIKMHEANLMRLESKLGPDHPDTLSSRNNLAEAYRAAGRTDDAIKMHEATLKQRESKLGADHADTLSSRNNLALAYDDAGRAEDAMKMHATTLRTQESKFGPGHPDTLKSRANLARAYLAAGRTDVAIKMHEATLKQRESKLGPDHPDTLNSRMDLADAYQAAGRIEVAIKTHEATLKQFEAKLGPDHPNTLTSRNNLATCYSAAGRIGDAVQMHEVNLKQQESKLGLDHPHTLNTRNNLAVAYLDAGRTDDAIKMHETNLTRQESKLGADHPDTLIGRNNLAMDYNAAGRAQEAIKMFEVNLKLFESKVGLDHPNTLTTRNNLASSYLAVGRTDDAIKMHEATLKQFESKFGPDHPRTFISRMGLAEAYQAAGRTGEAIQILEATLKQQESILGPDHPDTLASRNNLANSYLAVGRTDDAITMHQATLKQFESKLGPHHPRTLIGRTNLAKDYRAAGQLDQAVSLLEQALQGFRAKVGPDHPHTINCEQLLIDAYTAAGRYTGSESLLRDRLERARKRFGSSDQRTAAAMASVGSNLIKQQKWPEAETILRELVSIREKALPDDSLRFNAMSQLGGALLGQGRYAEAEPLVIDGYEGMKARAARIPPAGEVSVSEAAERVIRLYQAWGKPQKAAEWKVKLGLADLPDNVFGRP